MRKAKGPKNTAKNNKNFVTHLMTMPQAAGKKEGFTCPVQKQYR